MLQILSERLRMETDDRYLSGLEMLAARGKPLDQVSSVASFFLSRIDVLIDPLLEKKATAANVAGLHGQAAIANAKVAYQIYHEIFGTERFRKLAQMGARTQRLLWASTILKTLNTAM
jgi:transaldolase